VEVNGINIANENHKQVVERIKAIPNDTRLLVVDAEADAWYKVQKIVVRGTQKNVIYLQNPARNNGGESFDKENSLHEEVFISPPVPSTPPISEEPSGSSSNSAAAEIHSKDRKSVHSRSNSVHEETIERVDIHDLHFPPPPPEITEVHHEEKRTHTKRPSVTFVEYAPVAVVNPTFEETDHQSHHQSHHDKMKEVYQETTTVAHDAHQVDDLSSQLTGFKVLGEDIPVENQIHHHQTPRNSALSNGDHKKRDSVSAEHVHFETGLPQEGGPAGDADTQPLPRIWGAVYEPSPPAERKEFIEERVVHSPAFPAAQNGSPKEEFSEKVEVHRQHSAGKPVITYNDTKPVDSLSEDSGSRSLSSAENHSDKENGMLRNDDDISFEENKTPSPSPAVIARPPIASNQPTANGNVKTAEPAKPSEKPLVPPKPSPSQFGNLALNLSVQEMRATLSRNRKKDPRSQPMDLRKKHELIDNM
jgi:hypothetical protein